MHQFILTAWFASHSPQKQNEIVERCKGATWKYLLPYIYLIIGFLIDLVLFIIALLKKNTPWESRIAIVPTSRRKDSQKNVKHIFMSYWSIICLFSSKNLEISLNRQFQKGFCQYGTKRWWPLKMLWWRQLYSLLSRFWSYFFCYFLYSGSISPITRACLFLL